MPLTYKQAIQIAKDFGFLLNRQSGSHQQFRSDKGEVTIPFKKDFPIGTGKSIIKKIAQISGSSVEEITKRYAIKF